VGYVTKEQVARAKQIHVFDYVQSYESDKIKRVGSSYRLKEHPSVAISDKGYYRHSQEYGGVTALDYLIKIRGYDFIDAVCHLINESPYEKGDTPNLKKRDKPSPTTTTNKPAITDKTTSSEKVSLLLPRRDKDNYHAIAYLQNRGIDKVLIMDCINRGVLYQSAVHHNVVFIGKDEHGKTRFAAMRGTSSNYKCDAEGSIKKYGFVLPPNNLSSNSVAIFESPIDSMSHFTLCKRGEVPAFDGWRLSLGGMCVDTLTQFLKHHSRINYCLICTDNDNAGNYIAERISQEVQIRTERSLPIFGKDWNETLVATLQHEKKNTTIQQDKPIL